MLQIPKRLFQIFNRIPFVIRPDDILDHIAKAEVQSLIVDKIDRFDLTDVIMMRVFDRSGLCVAHSSFSFVFI